MSLNAKTYLQPLLLVGLGLVVGFGLGETLVRLTGAARPGELGPLYDRPEVYFERENPRPRHRRSGEVVVTVIGDSFTKGVGVSRDDAYPARLERLLNLNEGTPRAYVNVLAEPGSSTRGQLRFLENALRLKPSLIVLGVVLNDTEHQSEELDRLRQDLWVPRMPTGWTRELVTRSDLLRLVYERFETVRSQRNVLEYFDRIYEPEYRGWILFREALDEFKARCEESGVPLVAMIFPAMQLLEPAKYPFRHQHERLGWALEEAGIQYFDLLESYLGKSELRMSAHPGVDAHPSEIAHRIAADSLFEYLLDSGLVNESYAPRRGKQNPREKALLHVWRRQHPVALLEATEEEARED